MTLPNIGHDFWLHLLSYIFNNRSNVQIFMHGKTKINYLQHSKTKINYLQYSKTRALCIHPRQTNDTASLGQHLSILLMVPPVLLPSLWLLKICNISI